MIKRIATRQECPKLFDYCYEQNLRKEDRVYFFYEDKAKYFSELEYFLSREPFFVFFKHSSDEATGYNSEIDGAAFVTPPSDGSYPIKGLWGSKNAKNNLLDTILEQYDFQEIYLTVEKANVELIDIVKNKGFELWESAAVIVINELINAPLLDRVKMIKIDRHNFDRARPYTDCYFSDYYWNTERLLQNIERRDLVLFVEGDEVIGIAQGVFVDEHEAEIFAVIPFDNADLVDLTIRYTNYLLEQSRSVLYFLEDTELAALEALLKHGFELQSETQTYRLRSSVSKQ